MLAVCAHVCVQAVSLRFSAATHAGYRAALPYKCPVCLHAVIVVVQRERMQPNPTARSDGFPDRCHVDTL